eukprot:m.141156 g.141156  ORF g.141156 m.141156 type:complete len:124 (+) comp9632_c0_seq13:819-1190(+)
MLPPAVLSTRFPWDKPDACSPQVLIPIMPLWLAIILAFINVVLPGIGTILAGLSVCCCSNVGDSGTTKVASVCANFWVGLAQLILSAILIGWLWSIFWGFLFITQSQTAPRVTTTTVITRQPH